MTPATRMSQDAQALSASDRSDRQTNIDDHTQTHTPCRDSDSKRAPAAETETRKRQGSTETRKRQGCEHRAAP
eukprot:3019806-Rhodomonas_salina.2